MNSNIIEVKTQSQPAMSYPIVIGTDLFSAAGTIIPEYVKYGKAVVVTNTTVFDLYRDKFNFDAEYVVIPDGEEFKNFETYKYIQTELVKHNLTRQDCIIALGGGVVGDISGFAAATYMRGINLVQVPTTLLAQVDSSVGGKVAINLEYGKNLIGAFYQPKLVLTDINTLKTLDKRQLKTGLGEVLKYAFIEENCNFSQSSEDETFFEFLSDKKENIYKIEENTISQLIKRCCQMKADIVNADEKESGIRAVLNFGHTFAHAVEKCTEYKQYTHGEAVSIGMKMAFDLSLKLNTIDCETCQKAKKLIDFYGLIDKLSFPVDEDSFLLAITHDKKVLADKIRFVLADKIGKVEIKNVNDKQSIKEVLAKYVN